MEQFILTANLLKKKRWQKIYFTMGINSQTFKLRTNLKLYTIHSVTQRSELVCTHNFEIDTTPDDKNHIYICTKCGKVQTCG